MVALRARSLFLLPEVPRRHLNSIVPRIVLVFVIAAPFGAISRPTTPTYVATACRDRSRVGVRMPRGPVRLMPLLGGAGFPDDYLLEVPHIHSRRGR